MERKRYTYNRVNCLLSSIIIFAMVIIYQQLYKTNIQLNYESHNRYRALDSSSPICSYSQPTHNSSHSTNSPPLGNVQLSIFMFQLSSQSSILVCLSLVWPRFGSLLISLTNGINRLNRYSLQYVFLMAQQILNRIA